VTLNSIMCDPMQAEERKKDCNLLHFPLFVGMCERRLSNSSRICNLLSTEITQPTIKDALSIKTYKSGPSHPCAFTRTKKISTPPCNHKTHHQIPMLLLLHLTNINTCLPPHTPLRNLHLQRTHSHQQTSYKKRKPC